MFPTCKERKNWRVARFSITNQRVPHFSRFCEKACPERSRMGGAFQLTEIHSHRRPNVHLQYRPVIDDHRPSFTKLKAALRSRTSGSREMSATDEHAKPHFSQTREKWGTLISFSK